VPRLKKVTEGPGRLRYATGCFERLVSVSFRTSGNDVSVSSRCCHSHVSVSSWSRHHTCHLQPCFVGLRAIAVWPIDFI